MRFLALLSDNINLRKQGERVIFETRTKRVSLLLNNIYGILVFGRVHISGNALNFILSRDIPVFFLTRFGRLKGILYTETLMSNYNNRLNQYEAHIHRRVEIARFLVNEKIESIETIFGINLEAEKLLLKEAESVDQIMGIEGIVSKKMFDRVKDLLREAPLPFEERSYHPPKDEVNALLSKLEVVEGYIYEPRDSFRVF